MAKTEEQKSLEKAAKEAEKAQLEKVAALEAEIAELKASQGDKPEEKTVETAPQVVEVQKHDLSFEKVTVEPQILKNTRGENVDVKDYFYAKSGETAVAPNFFNKACGLPVNPMERPELIEIFDKIFKPEDNFVFLKSKNSEVYSVLVPLKFTEIGGQEDSILGDYQLHAISFIPDGSVNFDKLKAELKKIASMIKYHDR